MTITGQIGTHLRWRTRLAIGGLAVAALLAIALGLAGLTLFEDEQALQAGQQHNFTALRVAIWALFVPPLVTGVPFIVWLYGARSALGRDGLSFGPGWTIGSWFVPVGSLVLPLLVVGEVDKHSDQRGAWAAGVAPRSGGNRWGLAVTWWILYLISLYTGPSSVVMSVGLGAAEGDASTTRTVVYVVDSVAAVVAALAAVLGAVLVWRITVSQRRWLAAYAPPQAPAPFAEVR